MRYASPIIQTLSLTVDNTIYTKHCYAVPESIQGVDDEGYNIYDNDTTYNAGDFVKVDEFKRLYECMANDTSGVHPLSNTLVWIDRGFTNEYKMFAIDEQIGDSTTGTDITIEGVFNRLNTLAFLDINFQSVQITQIDTDTDEILYDKNISGIDIGCTDFAGYFYDDYTYKTRLIITDLIWHPNSTIKVTFAGDVTIGNIVVGKVKDLGITLIGTSLKFEDKSLIADNTDTQIRSVIRYGHTRVLTANVIFDNDDFNITAQKITKIIGKNTLFIPTQNDLYNEMTSIAYIEDFEMPVDNFTKFETSITLIGVVKNDNSN